MRTLVLFALVFAFACSKKGDEVVVYTSVDMVFSQPVFRHCEKTTKHKVKALFDTEETKSTGVLNRLISEAKNPQADVFWSGDPVRPFLLMKRDLVEPYRSPNAAALPTQLRASDGTWTGIAARARVLLVNTELAPDKDMPRSIRDLASPRFAKRTAIANPLFGTTTMHVAALASALGDKETKTLLNAMKANGIRIASSNGEVKRLVVNGEVAFGLTDTDDAYEAVISGAPVRIVYPDQDAFGTLVMPTTVVMMRNAPHKVAGQKLIDCLLSPAVEAMMAKNGAHMPLRRGVQVPKHVRAISDIHAMAVDYQAVAKAMEKMQPWLRDWAGL